MSSSVGNLGPHCD